MTEQAQARPEETAQGLLEGLRSGRARVIVEDAEGCHSRVYGAATVAEAAGRLVPAVTPEAVKATKLWELLAFADHDVKTIPTYAERLDEYDTLHLRRRVSWEDEKGSYYWWELTEQGRTIHAALQQARGHLTMTQQDLAQYDADGTGDADLREGLRRCREVNGQALASLASGEPTTDAATGGKE